MARNRRNAKGEAGEDKSTHQKIRSHCHELDNCFHFCARLKRRTWDFGRDRFEEPIFMVGCQLVELQELEAVSYERWKNYSLSLSLRRFKVSCRDNARVANGAELAFSLTSSGGAAISMLSLIVYMVGHC